MKQLDHYETMRNIRSCPSELLLCLCGVTCENLGLILRTADVFAVKKIFYYGEISKNESKIIRVSRGASIPVEFTDSLPFVHDLRQDGYTLTALEITDESVPLRTFAFPSKTCLIVGNERHGVPQELLDIVDNACYIEMYGNHISSLNVSISTAIALNRYMEFITERSVG
ncbi:MAG: TrmH family RNA methyltransferase [Clostridia bacterium]|nr:TrmH family RNA methyltransferase [Clostridia bacterium]